MNGNVGIGNSAPTGLLQVSANAMVVSSNGYVGIGTTAPGAKFEVRIDGESNGILATIGSPASGLRIHNMWDNRDKVFLGQSNLSTDKNNGVLLLYDNNENIGVKISAKDNYSQSSYFNGGNIGIGTVDPQTKLEVAGTVSANAFTGDGSGLTNIPGASTAYGADAGAGDDSVYIGADNKVGIGTTNPQASLHVNSGFMVERDLATAHADNLALGYIGSNNPNPTDGNYSALSFTGYRAGDSATTIKYAGVHGIFADHTNVDGELAFITRSNDDLYERMRIASSG
ncbi:MAG: hypothetical protein ABIH39_00900, partial [Candidatus Margulisiibacteriota bacterium]